MPLFAALSHRRSRKVSPENNSIGACLMRVTNPFTGEGLAHKELMANVAPFLIGGFDTSTSSVTWALYNIARSPEVAQRLEQELMDAGLITKDGKPGEVWRVCSSRLFSLGQCCLGNQRGVEEVTCR